MLRFLCLLKNISIREESERHSSHQQSNVEDDGDDDQVEDLSMTRPKIEKVSPPPSPVPVASVPNSDAAVPAQPGVIVPPQK